MRGDEFIERREFRVSCCFPILDILFVIDKPIPKVLLPVLLMCKDECLLTSGPLRIPDNSPDLLHQVPRIWESAENGDKTESRIVEPLDEFVLVNPEPRRLSIWVRDFFAEHC